MMSKRRISHQQSARIKRKQQLYHSPGKEEINLDGLVITRYGRHARIEDLQGNRIHCSIRPNLDPVVAGDRVIWQATGNKEGIIVSLCPRESLLGRPDKRNILKPVAANITQVMIVIAVKPGVSWSLLDSYLVMAECLNLKACIILNKVDLPCAELKQQLIGFYAPLNYSLLFTGHADIQGYQDLQTALNDNTSVFVGQSGVGKSSLIKQILPLELRIQTGAISTQTNLGCHTTRNSCLYHLPAGGALIDSPGVREFGLWHMSDNKIANGFREFQPFLGQCRFRNCNHRDAPGCALLDAVDKGLVSQNRYNSYLTIRAQFAK